MSGVQQVAVRQNQRALYRLPAELLLNILDRLDILEFPSVISAMFPLLRHHGIAPPISAGERSAMRSAVARGLVRPHLMPCATGRRSALATLPIELLLQTTSYLSTAEKVNFTIATWREFTVIRNPNTWGSRVSSAASDYTEGSLSDSGSVELTEG